MQETDRHTQSTAIVCPAGSELGLVCGLHERCALPGGRFRTFNVLEDFNRETLVIEIDTSLTSSRLGAGLRTTGRTAALAGCVLRTDNGPEFLGAAFTDWCADQRIFIDYIEPGKPDQNAYIERSNRSYRTEVLGVYLFSNLEKVREITWKWVHEY